MEKKYNLMAIIVSLTILLIGIILIVLELWKIKTESMVFMNVGCSLIASGIVLFISTLLVDSYKDYPAWSEWKLEKIYKTRSEKNKESDPKLETHRVKQLDGIAFGLKSFRSNRERDVLLCMVNGMSVRLLVMNPQGPFVAQREKEEKASEGSIATSIENLVEWAKKLNTKSTKGKIEIRYYNTMTLDFYWRMDDELYIGPYMCDVESQQTITYKYKKGGKGFLVYSNYFESLWEANEANKVDI